VDTLKDVRREIFTHLTVYQPWSVMDAANLAHTVVLRADPVAQSMSTLDLFLLVNTHAEERGHPQISYGASFAALVQYALTCRRVTIDTEKPETVHFSHDRRHRSRRFGRLVERHILGRMRGIKEERHAAPLQLAGDRPVIA